MDKVVNNSESITGALRLRLWATTAAYRGGTLNGYVLGTYQFDRQLAPQQYFFNIVQPVAFTAPPAGAYFTTFTVDEYTSLGWVIRDFATAPNPVNFGGNSVSTGSAPALQGTISWQIRDGILTLNADRVINKGTGATGSLRMRLWFTVNPYGGGTLSGYVAGAYQFPRSLNPGESFTSVSQ